MPGFVVRFVNATLQSLENDMFHLMYLAGFSIGEHLNELNDLKNMIKVRPMAPPEPRTVIYVCMYMDFTNYLSLGVTYQPFLEEFRPFVY